MPVNHSLNTLSTEKNYWMTFNLPNHTHTHNFMLCWPDIPHSHIYANFYNDVPFCSVWSILFTTVFLLSSNMETSDFVTLSWWTSHVLLDTVILRRNVWALFERLVFFSRSSSLLCSHSHLLKWFQWKKNSNEKACLVCVIYSCREMNSLPSLIDNINSSNNSSNN